MKVVYAYASIKYLYKRDMERYLNCTHNITFKQKCRHISQCYLSASKVTHTLRATESCSIITRSFVILLCNGSAIFTIRLDIFNPKHHAAVHFLNRRY